MPAKKSASAAKKAKDPAKKPAVKKTKAAVKKVTPKPKKAVIKTTESNASVDKFLRTIEEQKRKDSYAIAEMMKKATGAEPKMWGGSIIGFGNKLYVSPNTGRAVDWFLVGFSPRKANITLYLTVGLGHYPAELKKLGKHKTGGGCLYINKLSDVDTKVLQSMIRDAAKRNNGPLR